MERLPRGLITTKKAAAILGVTTQRVHQLRHCGQVPYLETPLGALYREEAIRALAEARKKALRRR